MANTLPSTMRRWQYTSARGGIEKHLQLNPSAPMPVPSSTESLVRVISVALNPVEYKVPETPFLGRLLVPKTATPGMDFAGQLIQPSPSSKFKAGQLVFGVSKKEPWAAGALSEYITVEDGLFRSIPHGVDVIDASTVSVAGLTAYKSIVPYARKGAKIFINGGSGGCGVFGIQMATAAGCHVTTSCSTPNVELCKSLGAEDVVDYRKGSVVETLKSSGVQFDHIVDNVGSDPELYWDCHKFSKPDATFVMVGRSSSRNTFVDVFKMNLIPGALGGGKRKFSGFWLNPTDEELEPIGQWMMEGKVRAVIDQKFSFDEVPQAFTRLKTGRAKGKVVVDVASETYQSG